MSLDRGVRVSALTPGYRPSPLRGEDASPAPAHFTLFIHFNIGAVTDVSAVFGENTRDIWL